MSYAYRAAVKANGGKNLSAAKFRKFNSRPGKIDSDGNILYTTEQAHKDACDINNIISTYDRTGLVPHMNRFEAQFGDLSGEDFKTMMDKVIAAQNSFGELPSTIRNEFNNDPAALLEFMDNPDNRDKAIELGLIRKEWTPETDGLGEHITDPSQRISSSADTEGGQETP